MSTRLAGTFVLAFLALCCIPIAGIAGDPGLPTLAPAPIGVPLGIRGDLAAAGLPGVREAAITWRDFDGDGSLDFALTGNDGPVHFAQVYRSIGAGEYMLVTACTTASGITKCEGDQSTGVKITQGGPLNLWVQNLSTNVAPGAGVHGIEATVTGGTNQAGPALEVHFVSGSRAIVTHGNGAHGILAKSQGGVGGRGSNASNWNPFYGVAYAGDGSAGAVGGTVLLANDGAITTDGAGAHGVVATSAGGTGGAGGDAAALYYAEGGNGAVGGAGGQAAAGNTGTIATHGEGAHGVFAQSLGGGGGGSGGAGATVANGGRGGSGGKGGNALLENSGSVTTSGADSYGLFALSQGGNGAGGGGCGGAGAIAGSGGTGGDGGLARLTNHGAVVTHGDGSHGLVALSQGGNGGGGGNAGGAGAEGGDGGGGGRGGNATVTNDGSITTEGAEAHGILARAAGGTGGSGGSGGGIYGGGGGSNPSGAGGKVDVTNAGTILTKGAGSNGVLAQSIGGMGGAGGGSGGLVSIGGLGATGGNGDSVRVANSAGITTQGSDARGILAQSIGGGGGSGAGSGGLVSLGGAGSAGGHGGYVAISNTGTISTSGKYADGILAQSIGGGGGNGAGSGGWVSIGGSGSATGDGAGVRVENGGAITTADSSSHAILAQSIGGGGGNGGGSGGALSFGGAGGSGGSGDSVTVAHSGSLATHGDDAAGILAQSIGGGGGNGGASGSASAYISISMGGKGGPGGSGSAVLVSTGAGSIATEGDRAYGIHAQSIGGGGGNGGLAISAAAGDKFAASVALGGSGGDGGHGGTANVSSGVDISTKGDHAHGIMAESIGGGGGSGGFSLAFSASTGPSASLAVGGSGGKGGSGGAVNVHQTGDIATSGLNSYGIMAQSVGGGGGDGGGAIAGSVSGKVSISASFGGKGGLGGAGGHVAVTNEGGIATTGGESHGVFAQSVGGGGGSGGYSVHIAGSTENSLGFGLGGSGGSGGKGGIVDVSNKGRITTAGDRSFGILAQSVGGGGGSGGSTYTLGGLTQKNSLAVSIGGAGGLGGHGDDVRVGNEGSILTNGAASHGIFAQSVGGGGGDGGSTMEIALPSLPSSAPAPAGARGLHAGTGVAGSGGAMDSMTLNLSVTIGGKGGAAGSGGAVSVTNSGSIATKGALSNGIFVQSVGGGGGSGGTNVGIELPGLPGGGGGGDGDGAKVPSLDLSLGIGVGGSGGAAGNGDSVRVANSGGIETDGDLSHGIFAQSVGGGGGSEIAEMDNPLAPAEGVFPAGGIGITVGGSGGAAGHGGAVDISNSGSIATHGLSSHGIFAQSVGGGGGQGAEADAGVIGLFSLGGRGGASGNGGNIGITNAGAILTTGEASYGILAQSVGGGGGVGGDVKRGLGDLNIGTGWGFGGDGTQGGTGGAVSIANTGDITTLGDFSIGIFAQSVGGGGGVGGGAGNLNLPIFYSFAGSVGGAGSGGAVSVTQTGDIATQGEAAHGIFAQSAGGSSGAADHGGDVTVSVTGDVLASGKDANGIMAQSTGSEGNGNIVVEIQEGTVQGGTGTGTGVVLLDGASNQLTNHGTISTLGGFAIRGTGGNETVLNYGTVSGSVDLGGGTNSFENVEGARLESGATLDLGEGGVLTNAGTLSPGGADGTMTTTLGSSYVQTGTGTFELTVSGSEMDRLVLTDGSATLDGSLKVVADHEKYVDGATYDIIQVANPQDLSGTFDSIELPHSEFLDFDVQYLDGGVRVSVDVETFESHAGNPVTQAIGHALDTALEGATGDFSHMIGAFQISATPEQVKEAFASLSPATYDDITRGALQSVRLHEEGLARRIDAARPVVPADPEAAGPEWFGDRSGWWLGGGREGADQDASGGYASHNFTLSGALLGYERAGGHSLFGITAGAAKTETELDDGMASGETNSFTGSLYGGYLWSRAFAQAVFTYMYNDIENSRDLSVGAEQRTALGEFNGGTFSALVTGGPTFWLGRWRTEPFVSLRYANVREDAVAETGAGGVDLLLPSRSTSWLGSDLGLRLTTGWGQVGSRFVPELMLAWNHDFGLDDRNIEAAFEAAPNLMFTIPGQEIASDGATLGAGLTYQAGGGWIANVRYERVQRSDYAANGLTLRIGSNF